MSDKNNDKGLTAKLTSAEDAPICWIYATNPPMDIIIRPTLALVFAKASFISLKKSRNWDPVGFLAAGTLRSKPQAKSNITSPENKRTA